MTTIIDRTLTEETNAFANYLPNGRIFAAKNKEDAKLRQLITGIATENQRVGALINQLLREHDINNTTVLIDEWERAVGIPDDCFQETTSLPIEQRRRQVIGKLFMRVAWTRDDYLALAGIIWPGMPIDIFYLPGEFFTARMRLPMSLCDAVFPLPFPLPFGGCPNVQQVCVFNKIKPANSKIIYIFDL